MDLVPQRPKPLAAGLPRPTPGPPSQAGAAPPGPAAPMKQAPALQGGPSQAALPASAFRSPVPQSMQNKFRAARKSSSREYYDTTSFYRAAEAHQDADEPLVSTPRPRTRPQIGAQVRRARPGALAQAGKLGPVLDALVQDGRSSGDVGRQAGLPELPHGGGLFGAVARRAGVRLGAPVVLDRTDLPLAPAVPSQSFLQKSGVGLRQAPMLSPAPRAPTPPTPAAVGNKRLGDVLRQAAGRVGDLLFQSELGAQLLAIETMQDALRGRSVELLRAQKLQPTWG